MKNLTITKIHKGLLSKKFSAVELAKDYLKKIKKEKISSFITITEDLALKQAKEADKLISEKKKISALTGVPIAVKDNILVRERSVLVLLRY